MADSNIYSIDSIRTAGQEWWLRNLPRGMHYEDAAIIARLSLSSDTFGSKSLAIQLTPKNSCVNSESRCGRSQSEIQFFTKYSAGFGGTSGCITFQDMRGNADEYQGKGYGTLCANLALQVWRCVLTDEQKEGLKISGNVIPVGDDATIAVKFFRSLGLTVDESDVGSPEISALFSDWLLVDRNKRSTINTLLTLDELWPSYRTMVLLPCDKSNYKKIVGNNDFFNLNPPSQSEVNDAIKGGLEACRKSVSIAAGLLFALVVGGVLGTIYDYAWYEELTIAALLFGFGSMVMYASSMLEVVQFQLNRFPLAHDEPKSLQERRSYALKAYRKKIASLGNNDQGFLYRLTTAIGGKVFTESLPEKYQSLLYKSQYYELDLSDDAIVQLIDIISHLEKYKKNRWQSAKKNNQRHDFLFGDVENLSIDKLNVWAEELTDQFEFHINRLLSSSTNNYVSCEGSSYTKIVPMLSHLKHVARIEIYPSDIEDSNPSVVGIRLYLQYGIVDLQACWTGWRNVPLEEVLHVTLDLELSNPRLVDKTFVIFGDNRASYKTTEDLAVAVVDLIGGKNYSEKHIKEAMGALRGNS